MGRTAATPGSSTITTAALRASCYSGLSYSTDNGVTWHASQPLCTGHGTNFGDPIVVYNAHLGTWFAGDLATGCGGQGIGLWTSPDGVTWTTGACASTPAAATTGRACGWTTTRPALSTGGCTSPSTTSPSAAVRCK